MISVQISTWNVPAYKTACPITPLKAVLEKDACTWLMNDTGISELCPQIWSNWPQMGQIWNFLKYDVFTFLAQRAEL